MTHQELRTKLREAAGKATKGEWIFARVAFDNGDFAYEINEECRLIQFHERDFDKRMMAKFDSEYIATACPQNILALLDEFDRMEKKYNKALDVLGVALDELCEDK